MAEGAIISFAQRLGVIVLDEYRFLHGVQDQAISLRDELQWISSFLKDAEMQGKKNERVDIWVSQIRDLSYDAEDVLDVFILTVKRLRGRSIRRLIKYPGRLITLHKLGEKIDRINKRIDRISNYKSKYAIDKIEDIESLGKDVALDVSKASQDWGEDDIVGFDSQSEAVKELLKQEHSQELHVVSIVGIPGSGKTSLAQKVYNDIKYQFDSCAWIHVSTKYKPKILLENIKRGNQKKEDMGNLLVVFDDVRRRRDWEALEEHVLGKIKSTKCTILLTSRFGKVAKRANSIIDPYDIRPLEKNHGLELLKKAAFREKTSCFPEQLEQVAGEIVNKCEGLPLALVVLGGLFSRKPKTESVWNKVLHSVRWQLRHGSTSEWLDLPSFSYDNLPNSLKPCFLYVALFPEDSPIDCEKLIQLWIAEGFIQERGLETIEDVAEHYLEDLIQRNMVQTVYRRFDGSLKKCRIHDLFREFAISKGRQDKFLDVLAGNKGSATTRTMSRRIAVHSTNEPTNGTEIPKSCSANNPRSILCFNNLSNVRLEDESFYKSFKLLRVLDLRGATVLKVLSNQIGKLVLLKYLNLHGTRIHWLPPSIRNLRNLLTLDISETQINSIPWSVWELEELRNFYANLYFDGGHNQDSDNSSHHTCNDGLCYNLRNKIIDYYHSGASQQICRLTNLRTLSARGDRWIRNDFWQLTNLRKLQITEVNMEVYGEVLSSSIHNFTYLGVLDIDWSKGTLQFPDSLSQHIHLYRMRLSGVMLKLPAEATAFPPNLTVLQLCHTDLKQEEGDQSMENLAQLKNLKFLELSEVSFSGNQMVFRAEGFPNLIRLDLLLLEDLREWKVEQGSLRSLKVLNLVRLGKLEEIPDGLQQVTTLQLLRLLGMSPELLKRVEKDVGLDWYKIKHIPTIKFKSGKYKVDLLYDV